MFCVQEDGTPRSSMSLKGNSQRNQLSANVKPVAQATTHQVELHTTPGATPRFHKARKVLYSLKESVEEDPKPRVSSARSN